VHGRPLVVEWSVAGVRSGDAAVQHPKRSQHKYAKSSYKIGKWAAYEAGLRGRGDLTIWLPDDAIQGWTPSGHRKAGGMKLYTNLAIKTALAVRMVYHLSL